MWISETLWWFRLAGRCFSVFQFETQYISNLSFSQVIHRLCQSPMVIGGHAPAVFGDRRRHLRWWFASNIQNSVFPFLFTQAWLTRWLTWFSVSVLRLVTVLIWGMGRPLQGFPSYSLKLGSPPLTHLGFPCWMSWLLLVLLTMMIALMMVCPIRVIIKHQRRISIFVSRILLSTGAWLSWLDSLLDSLGFRCPLQYVLILTVIGKSLTLMICPSMLIPIPHF